MKEDDKQFETGDNTFNIHIVYKHVLMISSNLHFLPRGPFYNNNSAARWIQQIITLVKTYHIMNYLLCSMNTLAEVY